jgi:hypothetical protein
LVSTKFFFISKIENIVEQQITFLNMIQLRSNANLRARVVAVPVRRQVGRLFIAT